MKKTSIGDADLYLGDCMDFMELQPDNAFDLAIVDPPYGIGNRLLTNGPTRTKIAQSGKYKLFDNSKPPDPEYFEQLKRVSTNQIIWGANHFCDKFNAASCAWIIWDKDNTGDFADCELAYSSFNFSAKKFKYMWNGMHQGQLGGDKRKNETRIHPTQKPIKLYEWLLTHYAYKDARILDTHLGSGSSAIAANKMGIEFTGIEIDEDYYAISCERIEQLNKQRRLFA